MTTSWHTLAIDQVFHLLKTSSKGLTSAGAEKRQQTYGKNVLSWKTRGGLLSFLIRHLNNPLVYVLFLSGVIALAMQQVTDGLVVMSVIVLNTCIGMFQDFRAQRAIQELLLMVPESCLVLRDEEKCSVEVHNLVPGDIVYLSEGERIGADIRLIFAEGLKIDESILTGESIPTEKCPDPISDPSDLTERRNMAFSGTLVVAGSGQGVVVGIGRETALGSIAHLMKSIREIKTPLVERLEKLCRHMTVFICCAAALLLALALFRSYSLASACLASISLAVGAIPEGLPPIIAIALALGAKRMAYRNAIVRHSPVIETLGSTTLICSDKTGTLTQNQMTVREICIEGSCYQVRGVGYEPEGEIELDGRALRDLPSPLVRLFTAAILCNNAHLMCEDNEWKVKGDPTEGALLVAARKAKVSTRSLRHQYKRIGTLPFDSKRQFMASVHESPQGTYTLILKGSPEAILHHCRGAAKETLEEEVNTMAKRGMRVLGFAEKTIASPDWEQEIKEPSFAFLGFIGMMDPPRPDAITSIEACKGAGIEVKMITGDHPLTAGAIGKELGLSSQIITGKELDKLNDEEFAKAALTHSIFARVTPEHKLKLVKSFQAHHQVVTMTGDGVNDAPALQQADVGVAMGISGTSVAKESADLVLLDDRFSSIEAAVEEGRRVYDNIVKAIAFILPTNFALGGILVASIGLFPTIEGVPLLPLLPSQILWINLLSAIGLSLPLAFEPIEPDTMKAPPRKRHAPLLSSFIWWRTIFVSLINTIGVLSFFLWQYSNSHEDPLTSLRAAQTSAVTLVIFFQCFYLLKCRSLYRSFFSMKMFRNPSLFGGILFVLALQAIYMYTPLFQDLFHSAPLPLVTLWKAFLVSSLIVPIISIEKYWRALKFCNQLK